MSGALPTVCSPGGTGGYYPNSNLVALEIDTYRNSDVSDPATPHFGLGFGTSTASVATKEIGTSLINQVWNVWVEYNGGSQRIETRASTSSTRPTNADISYNLNMYTSIGSSSTMKIGFGGANGMYFERNRVLYFQTTFGIFLYFFSFPLFLPLFYFDFYFFNI
jgi:hypothetical protein